MKKFRYIYSLFLFLFWISFQNSIVGNISAGNFNNAGTMTLRNSCFRVREVFDNTGQVIAEEMNDCICGTLTGNGLFKGSRIKIIAQDFQFTGVIESGEECLIITSKPFEHSICTFKGKGKVVFKVDASAYDAAFADDAKREEIVFPRPVLLKSPNPVSHSDWETLKSTRRRSADIEIVDSTVAIGPIVTEPLKPVYRKFKIVRGLYAPEQLVPWFKNYVESAHFLSLTPYGVDVLAEEVVCYVQENHLNLKESLNQLAQTLNSRIDYNEQHIGKEWDTKLTMIGATTILAGLGAFKLCWTYLGAPEFKNADEKITFNEFAYFTSFMTTIMGVALAKEGLLWDHHYKERYTKLVLLKAAIERAQSAVLRC